MISDIPNQLIFYKDYPSKNGARKITLCGTTRYKRGFLYLQQRLSIEGNMIYSVEVFGHADGVEHTRLEKATLDALHLMKIAESDLVVVITDQEGYVGESTEREIEYARLSCTPVLMAHFRQSFLEDGSWGVDEVGPIEVIKPASPVPGDTEYA